MPPRKRKAPATATNSGCEACDDRQLWLMHQKLDEIDAAVEERCEAIKAAAEEAVTAIMQQLQLQLLQLPKKVRLMPFKDYVAAERQKSSELAVVRVDSKLEAAQQQSLAITTAAPTTRSLRSRARSAVTAATAEPRVTRTAHSTAVLLTDTVQPTDAAAASSPAKSTLPAAESVAAGVAVDAQRAAALGRAQIKVDAKLAALGLAANTAVRGADRTVLRQLKPGETCFSKNGSPLSIHPNITRHRGRTGAASLMTPAMQAAVPPGASALGCITLIKKQPGPATAATGRGKRGKTAAAEQQQAGSTGTDGSTVMMITTDDGKSFTVDAAAGGLEAVPALHRQEVAAKLKAIQQLAAAALGTKV